MCFFIVDFLIALITDATAFLTKRLIIYSLFGLDGGVSVTVSVFDYQAVSFHKQLQGYEVDPRMVVATGINPKLIEGGWQRWSEDDMAGVSSLPAKVVGDNEKKKSPASKPTSNVVINKEPRAPASTKYPSTALVQSL
ncbi:hypothetical protein Bca101_011182 [Brassica carinata]